MEAGIKDIGVYIPQQFVSAAELVEKFGVSENFVRDKTGFVRLARRGGETAADMCCKAYEGLSDSDIGSIDAVCVCSQNPDAKLPHLSALLQQKLGAKTSVFCLDISLGCSGYPYGIALCTALMRQFGFSKVLFFTCDPYSAYLEENDKNTQMLFGDAASVTLLATDSPVMIPSAYAFETYGELADKIYSDEQGIIHMDGRGIYNFCMRQTVQHIKKQIVQYGQSDLYLLHQASKFVLDSAVAQLNLEPARMPFKAQNYGNTVSSSIPLMLKEYLSDRRFEKISLVGFGVGLSVSSLILNRR